MSLRLASRRAHARALLIRVLLGGSVAPVMGCLTLRADHDELSQQVARLRMQVVEQDKLKALADELEAKLVEVEAVLRNNQADLGLRVQNLGGELQELRGAAENADFRASTASQELSEVRTDIDLRLKTLEERLNEATSIPEGKDQLWAEAERQFKTKNFKASRRLWRTFESRYPEDRRQPQVKFNVGLTYFTERDYKSALGEFYKIVQDTPKAKIVPDALYYSGLAFAKLGQCQNAIAYFNALGERKTKAPREYKKKAAEQVKILEKDHGDICVERNSVQG